MTSRGEHIRLDKGSVVKHHYEVVASVGSGNFSKVYRVVDLHLPAKEQKRKPLAMKVIKKEYSSDAKYEKQMLIALHKNDKDHTARVSKMYECFVFQECPVFIMPIHGPSIRNRRLGINRGVVTREKVLEFAFDILETMDFVHFQCHMVHTDLKPENILIADSNAAENSMGDEWIVCDFGSASLWRMDKLDSDLISTRPYRAPEVVLGNKWHYAADMWSVGCILYEVAVGHRLFEVRDDLTHLHLMDRRVGRLPEAFTKSSKYSSKFFNARGEFLSTPDVIRFGKCRLTPLRDMFRDDRDLLHLLEGLLVYDPSARMTATEAVALPMFDSVRVARRQRQEKQAAEAEARRQRRRAASAAGAGLGGTESESLASTMNSVGAAGGGGGAGPSPRLTDRTDRNVPESWEESKKPSANTLDSAPSSAAAQASLGGRLSESSRPVPGASADDVASKQHHLHMPSASGDADTLEKSAGAASSSLHTTRSAATDHYTSPASGNVSPGKDGRKARSNAGSTSRQSTTTTATTAGSTSGQSRSKSGKPRTRASGATAGGKRGSAGASSSLSASSPTAGGVVTKELPSTRPIVENHRASTGGASTTTTLVPKLALGRLGNTHDSTSAATTATSKGTRTAGSGSGRSRSSAKNAGGLSGHKSTAGRAASPGERHVVHKTRGSTGLTPTKGTKKDRKDSFTYTVDSPTAEGTRPSGATIASVAVMPRVSTNPTTAAGGADGVAGRNVRGVPTVTSPGPQAAAVGDEPRPSPLVESGVAPALSAAYPAPAALVVGPSVPATAGASPYTPGRGSSTAPPGYQSPLERGVTAIGITTRTESPMMAQRTPDQDGPSGGSGGAAGARLSGGSEGEERAEGSGGDASPSANSADASGRDSSSSASPRASAMPDCSPRATDYRSPVRRRPATATSTDDGSPLASPEPQRESTALVGGGAGTGGHTSPTLQGAPAALPNASGTSATTTTTTTAAPTLGGGGGGGGPRVMERAPSLTLTPAQPTPNLSEAVPTSDGRRTPREVSPAPVTGRVSSPMLSARRSAQFAESVGSVTSAGKASGPHDSSELTSTVPIVRGPQSRTGSRSGSVVSTHRHSPNADALARTGGPASTSSQTQTAAPSPDSSLMQAGHLVAARSPPIASVAPRAATASGRLSAAPVASAPSSGARSVPATPAASLTTVTPSMKPVIAVAAPADRLRSAPPQSSTDIRGPSAIPVAAARRTVTKASPVATGGASGIPEHPAARWQVAPTPSAPHGTDAASHPPEAVTRSRERSLVGDAAASPAATASNGEREAAAASRRSSASSPNLLLGSTGDAQAPKTPLPSATGVAPSPSLSLSGSLPSAAGHPTAGVVRQRSGSGQLLPAVVLPTAPASQPTEHGAPCMYTTVESKPSTPRGSGRASFKALDVPQLHLPPGASTAPRPPRSARNGSNSPRHPSPTAAHQGAGAKSPRGSPRRGPMAAGSGPAPPSTLSASLSSSHLGVARSPRRPVAPGANSGAPSLLASLDAASAVSLRSPRSSTRLGGAGGSGNQRSLSSSSASKEPLKTVSPRRVPQSPRGVSGTVAESATTGAAMSRGAAAGADDAPPVALSVPMQPLQQAAQQPMPAAGAARLAQPRRSVTLISSKPSSSAPAPLSRYSVAAAVAPTRASALRAPAGEAGASASVAPPSNGLNASYKGASPSPHSTTAGVSGVAATVQHASGSAVESRQNSASVTTDESNPSAGPTANSTSGSSATAAPKYVRDAKTLKRIPVPRPSSSQSPRTSVVSPAENGENDATSVSPPPSLT